MLKLDHFIDGALVDGNGQRSGPIYNPATGEVIGQTTYADASDVSAAVDAAERAFPGWARTPAVARARVMFKFKELVEKHRDELAELITREHGKVISDSIGSIVRGLEVVEFACGIPHLLKGEFTENVGTDVDSWSLRQPLGICAGITPFNFPAMVPMWMFPIAIACGNTFVLKPSEKTPSCPLRLAELLSDAGLPDGVFNVVNGDREAVTALLEEPRIASISFVGSSTVAEHIYLEGCRSGKRVQALGGAKNHLLVMPDADMDQATDALVSSAFGSAGERCMAVSVALATDPVADQLVERLEPRVRGLKVGPGNDQESEMGPLVSPEHLERVRGYIEAGVRDGAELVVDGRDLSLQGYEDGFFLGGCLFDRVSPEMTIYQDEIFGPVLSVVRIKDFDDAVGLINSHELGNGTAIFTRDGDAAREFATRTQIGMVGVNVPIPVPMAFHSFGGWKRSLFGDMHMHGPEGVRFFTRMKTLTSRWPTGIREGADFALPTMA